VGIPEYPLSREHSPMRYAKYLMAAFMAFVLVALYWSATAPGSLP